MPTIHVRVKHRIFVALGALVVLAGLVLAVAGPSPAAGLADGGAVAASDSAPELAFVADEHFLSTQIRIWAPDKVSDIGDRNQVGGDIIFDRVEVSRRSSEAGAVQFAVEGQPDIASYEYCFRSGGCGGPAVGILADEGELYLVSPDASRDRDSYVNDFVSQRLELSAADADTSLRVYREVMVHPSQRAPDCDDYPDLDAVRHQCLFLKEHLPPEPPETAAAMREALPDSLVQPKENYSLVFAEEFNYTTAENATGRCRNRMNNLNQGFAAWNFDTNPCNNVDALGVPCFDIEDGSFYIARTALCQMDMTSGGKLNYKYGYLEVKYSFPYRAWPGYVNYAFAVGSPNLPLRAKYRQYGLVIEDYGDILRSVGGVVNVFEYLPNTRSEVRHSWVNPHGTHKVAATPPTRTTDRIRYCPHGGPPRAFELIINLDHFCYRNADATVTKGIEWTPRGYRAFLKVEGVHDDLIVVGAPNVSIERSEVIVASDGTVSFGSGYPAVEDDLRDGFFEYLVDGDLESILEQVGISHVPMDLGIAAWGFPQPHETTVRSKLAIDYIRIFQPEDRYTDMEPVYQ